MADVWISNPRHFCDFCKCWIADNRPSKDFHEKGKKHKENVQRKITELRKKGVKDAQNREEQASYMEEMERAAMAAFKKDLENDPALAAQYGVKLKDKEEEPVPVSGCELPPPGLVVSSTSTDRPSSTSSEQTEQQTTQPPDQGKWTTDPAKSWSTDLSPEGYTYYWNYITGETTWVKPDGYEEKVAPVVEEPAPTTPSTESSSNQPSTDESSQDTDKETSLKPIDLSVRKKESSLPVVDASELPPMCPADIPLPPSLDSTPPPQPPDQPDRVSDESESEEEPTEPVPVEDEPEDEPIEAPQAHRPVRSAHPAAYGSWQTAQEPVTEPVDLQLPVDENAANFEEKTITLVPEAKIKFREKKVDTLGAEFVAFKKRKLAGGAKNRRGRPREAE